METLTSDSQIVSSVQEGCVGYVEMMLAEEES